MRRTFIDTVVMMLYNGYRGGWITEFGQDGAGLEFGLG